MTPDGRPQGPTRAAARRSLRRLAAWYAAVVIGFAAGVQALGIAALLSVGFALLELSIWYWDIADASGRQIRRIGLGEVTETVAVPPPAAEPVGRNQTLRVEVGDVARAHADITAVLDRGTKRWKLVKRDFGTGAAGALEYSIRLRRSVDPEELAGGLRRGTAGTIHALDWAERANGDGAPRPEL